MSYNGYRNYETWASSLWLDNDPGTHADVRAMAQDAREEAAVLEEEVSISDLAGQIKDYTETMLCANAPESGLAADLFQAAWSEIDWREIAENALSEE